MRRRFARVPLAPIYRKVLTGEIQRQYARKKISICLIRGHMELLGNDDVSVVYALNRLG